MDFVFNLDTEVASTAGGSGGSFGTMETGVYDVTIVTATLGKTKSKNNCIDLSLVTADGHEKTIYQAFILDEKWATGSVNHGYKDWMAFAVVMGLKGITTFNKPLVKEDGSPVMKNGQPVVLNAVKELDGKKCKLAIVKELDFYKGEVTEDNIVFASFTEAGLNANEKINSLDPEALGKLDGRLSDKKTKRLKAHIANGGSAEVSGDTNEDKQEPEVDDSDLGLD